MAIRKCKKAIAIFLAVLTLMVCGSVAAFAIQWNMGTSSFGASTSAGTSSSNLYWINSTDEASLFVGYRFSMVDYDGNPVKDSSGNTKFLELYTTRESYTNLEKPDVRKSKIEWYNKLKNNDIHATDFNSEKKTNSDSISCLLNGLNFTYNGKTYNLLTSLPIPSELENWKKDTANLNPILSALYGSAKRIDDLGFGDRLIIEPLWDVVIQKYHQSMTVTDIAAFGWYQYNGKEFTNAKSGTVSASDEKYQMLTIARFTNNKFANSVRTNVNDNSLDNLWNVAYEINSSRNDILMYYEGSKTVPIMSYKTLIEKGYGVGLAYRTMDCPVLSLYYLANGGTVGTNFKTDSDGYIQTKSGSDITQTAQYDNTITLKNKTDFDLSRAGYDFGGWIVTDENNKQTTTANAGEKKKTSELNPAIKNGNCEARAYAMWTPKTYTIKFYRNAVASPETNGVPVSTITKKYNAGNISFPSAQTVLDTHTASANKITNAKVDGWYTDKAYTNKASADINDLAAFADDDNVIRLYARTYVRVMYTLDDSAVNITSPLFTYGTPKNDGYTAKYFIYKSTNNLKYHDVYYNGSLGTDGLINPGMSLTGYNCDSSSYAGEMLWTNHPDSTSTKTPHSATYDSKTDYTYERLHEYANGKGNLVLCPKWSLTNYTITYNANGGSWPSSVTTPVTQTYNIKNGFSIRKYSSGSTNYVLPTKAGYNFVGWKVAQDGTKDYGNWKLNKVYSSGASINAGKYGDIKLVAQWEKIVDEYTIVFHRNATTGDGVTVSTIKKKDTSGATVTLPTASSVMSAGDGIANTKISNWYFNKTRTGTSYKTGATVPLSSLISHAQNKEIHLYAYSYVRVLYKLKNASEVNVTSASYTYGVPTTSGYEANYFCNKSDNTLVYHDLYYNDQIGGTGLINPAMSRIGYSCLSANSTIWTDDTNAATFDDSVTTYNYTDFHTYANVNGNVELYPKWTQNTYTITYKVNGGNWSNGSTADKKQNYKYPDEVTIRRYSVDGTNYILPTKSGSTFTGWKVTATDTSSSWKADEIFESSATLKKQYGNVTLTAQWASTESSNYTITYHSGEGYFSISGEKVYTRTQTYKSTDTFKIRAYTSPSGANNVLPTAPAGKHFYKWEVRTAVGNWTKGEYASGQSFTGKEGNVHLYAKYVDDINVVINVLRDNEDWIGNIGAKLYQGGTSKYTLTRTGNQWTAENVANGTYDLYAKNRVDGTLVDTKIDITVNNNIVNQNLNYYSVVLDADDGYSSVTADGVTGTEINIAFLKGTMVNIDAALKTGYGFVKWDAVYGIGTQTSTTRTTKTYTIGAGSEGIKTRHVYTAISKLNTYTVNYYVNNNLIEGLTQECIYGETYSRPDFVTISGLFTSEDANSSNWYTTSNLSGTNYELGSTFSNLTNVDNGTVNYYLKEYVRVYYGPNGGTVTTPTTVSGKLKYSQIVNAINIGECLTYGDTLTDYAYYKNLYYGSVVNLINVKSFGLSKDLNHLITTKEWFGYEGPVSEENVRTFNQNVDISYDDIVKLVDMNGNVYMLANWQVNKSTLEIDPNGGNYNNDPASVVITEDALTEIEISNPEGPIIGATFACLGGTPVDDIYKNKIFSYWTTSGLNNGNLSGTLVSNNGYSDYTFSRDDGKYDKITANYTPVVVTMPNTTREGYELLGWTTDYHIETAEYSVGENVSIDSDTTFYAVWKPITYNIVYKWADTEEVINNITPKTYVYGQGITLSNTYPACESYTVTQKWFADKDCKTAITSISTDAIGDIVIYVERTAIKEFDVKISANVNDDVYTKSDYKDNIVLVLKDKNGNIITPVKSENGINEYKIAEGTKVTVVITVTVDTITSSKTETITVSDNVAKTFYLYTVELTNGEGTINANGSGIYFAGDSVDISAENDIGYVWSGWTGTSTSNGKSTKVNLSDMESKITGINAHYVLEATAKVITYKVQYDKNCSDNVKVPDTQIKTFGVNLKLSETTPVRTGYTFAGWNTKSDGSGNSYKPNDTYNKNSDMTLYAQWTKIKSKEYDVKFNGNGATSGSMDNQHFIYDVAQNLTANAFVREFKVTFDYQNKNIKNIVETATATFNGWATTTTGNVTYLDKANVKNLTAEDKAVVNLYANWTDAKVTAPDASKEGYDFDGWVPADNPGTTPIKPGTEFTPDKDITYIPKFTPHKYDVKFNGNGATSGSMDNQHFVYDVAQNLTTNAFVREFKVTYKDSNGNVITTYTDKNEKATATFNGWATTKNGDVVYLNNANVKNLTAEDKAVVNLYANWTDGTVIAPDTSKEGYDFDGWVPEDNPGTTPIKPGTEFTPDRDITYIPKFTPHKYDVKFNGNGATSGSMDNQHFVYDVAQNLTTNAFVREFKVTYKDSNGNVITTYTDKNEKATATFNGWATTTTGNVTYLDKANVKNLTAEDKAVVNLYANWTDAKVTAPDASKEGYDFDGWVPEDNPGTTPIKPGTKFTPDRDITYISKFTPHVYQIVYHENYLNGNDLRGEEKTLTVDKTYGVNNISIIRLPESWKHSITVTYLDKDGSVKEKRIVPATAKNWMDTSVKKDGTVVYNFGDVINKDFTTENGVKIHLYCNWALGSTNVPDYNDDPGYKLDEWDPVFDPENPTNPTDPVYPDDIITPDFDVVYEPVLSPVIYTITCDNNGGVNGTEVFYEHYTHAYHSAADDKTVSIIDKLNNLPTKTGYTFDGYYTLNNAMIVDKAGKIVVNSSYFEADSTVKAKWTPIKYYIEYVGNGADNGTMENSEHVYDVEKALSTNEFSLTDKVFNGWNTKPDGSGESFTDKQVVINLTTKNNEVIKLYAQWIDKPADLVLAPITPNAAYKTNTDVITSFNLINNTGSDRTPDSHVTLNFVIYDGTTVIKTITMNDEIVPNKGTQLVYFKWHVPTGATNIHIESSITEKDRTFDQKDTNYTVTTLEVSNFNYVGNRHLNDDKVPDDLIPDYSNENSASWTRWVYENNSFVQKTYGIKANANVVISPDDNASVNQWKKCPDCGYANVENAIDKTTFVFPTTCYKCGASLVNVDVTTRGGTEIELDSANVNIAKINSITPANSYTVSQNVTALLPEQININTKEYEGYITLDSEEDGNYVFMPYYNEDLFFEGENVILIPFAYRSGNYKIVVCFDDIWTPAGMMSMNVTSNSIRIFGTYDDDTLG